MKSVQNWLDDLANAEKLCIEQSGIRKVHFSLRNGVELVEEYDVNSKSLVCRKWRRKSTLGKLSPWDIEIGEKDKVDNAVISESLIAPFFIRKDDSNNFQWRIRNLPYPIDTYSLSVDENSHEIVLRTANKKYYKRFKIPDLERLGIDLDKRNLTWVHRNNTLIISYKKPEEIMRMERAVLQMCFSLKAVSDGAESDCKQS